MTIHRQRLGADLLQGARNDKPLSFISIAIALFFSCLALVFLGVMLVYLWLAIQLKTPQAWRDVWNESQNVLMVGMSALFIPLSITIIRGARLYERIARRYALLGDDHWAPVLDVQPTPLTPDEQAQDTLNLGTIFDPKAHLATLHITFGVVLVAFGGGMAYLFSWWVQQSPPVPSGDIFPAVIVASLMSLMVLSCLLGGGSLFWHGVRLRAGARLVADGAALYVRTRRGHEQARIAWHEMRAFSARLPGTGADRTIYSLDTGDRMLVWVESRFDPPAVRAQRTLLQRAVVTRAGVPLRDVTRVYTRIPSALGDLYRWTRYARLSLDAAAATERDRAIWQPMRALWRMEHALTLFGAILLAIAILLEPTAFVLQRLLG